MNTQTRQPPTREQIIRAVEQAVLTPERVAHGEVRVRVSKRLGYDLKVSQVPLELYLSRHIISYSEYRAGSNLYRDFFISGQIPGMTINLDPIRGGERNFTQAQLDARQRWREAMKAVHGTIGQLMALNVCCYGYWLKDIPYLHYKTSQQAMARFHEAMEDLVTHYNLDEKF